FLRPVDFARPVDLRAVGFRAVLFLRPVDLRDLGLLDEGRVVPFRLAVFRPAVFFAANPATSLTLHEDARRLVTSGMHVTHDLNMLG
ncbi:MAG: hypothetical protein M3456_11150, partial [Actinomycetota bacterium]|nr:hypothetical protein [Actinomycetota bacterium]